MVRISSSFCSTPSDICTNSSCNWSISSSPCARTALSNLIASSCNSRSLDRSLLNSSISLWTPAAAATATDASAVALASARAFRASPSRAAGLPGATGGDMGGRGAWAAESTSSEPAPICAARPSSCCGPSEEHVDNTCCRKVSALSRSAAASSSCSALSAAPASAAARNSLSVARRRSLTSAIVLFRASRSASNFRSSEASWSQKFDFFSSWSLTRLSCWVSQDSSTDTSCFSPLLTQFMLRWGLLMVSISRAAPGAAARPSTARGRTATGRATPRAGATQGGATTGQRGGQAAGGQAGRGRHSGCKV
mmetsp:Transcript_99837/g.280706  ORF Transcript_99837/g.280706 Transcript_99837/m.280706 type:complete len:309 (-) Transcript_99837:16-942(-)